MTKTKDANTLLRLLGNAFESAKDAPGPHVIDDETLLARWSTGLLPQSEHQQVIRHLADCADCRDTIGQLVKHGAFRPRPPIFPVWRRTSFQVAAASLVAIAAALLIAVGLPGPRSPGSETRLGQSLALIAFDFQMNGESYGMALRVLPDDQRKAMEEKIARQPRDVRLRLEFGYLLLEHNRADEAYRQFEEALRLEPNNGDALVGKGVALYEQAYGDNREDYQPALAEFERALVHHPDHFSAHFNAAIVLDRGPTRAAAAQHWERAEELAPDEGTRGKIAEHRRRRATAEP